MQPMRKRSRAAALTLGLLAALLGPRLACAQTSRRAGASHWRGGVAIALAVASLASGCGERPKAATNQPPVVDVAAVAQRDVAVHSEWIGTAVGYVDAQIRALVAGYLLSQHYREGSLVKKGDQLFQIDPRPFQDALDEARAHVRQAESQVQQARAQVGQARAEIDQTHAELEQARAQVDQGQAEVERAHATQVKTELDVERYRPLAEDGSVSQQELEDAVQANLANKAGVSAARGNLARARANVVRAQASITRTKADLARAEANVAREEADVANAQAAMQKAALDLSFTRVISPIDGVAGIRAVNIGDVVGREQNTLLTTVSQVDPVYVEFPISEQEYVRTAAFWQPVEQGRDPARELELILADGSVYPHRGRVAIVGRGVEVTTGTFRIRGLFPNPGSFLRPGQYGKVRAATQVLKGALLVPQRAVTEIQALYQIAVVTTEDRVEIRSVTPGPKVGALWVIELGLRPGERVVVDGVKNVRAGEVVKPVEVAPAPAAPNSDPGAAPSRTGSGPGAAASPADGASARPPAGRQGTGVPPASGSVR
jgi:membrane fusion protein, multidrug efflux system